MEKYKEPQVYVINNSEIAEKLQERYVVAEGNLGIIKQIEYAEYENHKYVNLEYNLIKNLHEYKVVIIDLQNKSVGKICTENDTPDEMPYFFQIDYPAKQFNPAPFVMNQVPRGMNHDGIRIIFSDRDYIESYKIVEIVEQNRVGYPDKLEEGIYSTIGVAVSNKAGKKIKPDGCVLAQTIAKYADGYEVVFDLPTIWDSSKQKSVPDENYIPLIFNQDNEVVSYIGCDKDNGYELLLPVCQNKEKLVYELLS